MLETGAVWNTGPAGATGPQGPPGADGADGGSFSPSSIVVGNVDFDAANNTSDLVAYDTQVSVEGTGLSWTIADPTKVTVVTAGLYFFSATFLAGATHPAVGFQFVQINAPGGIYQATGNRTYRSAVDSIPSTHSIVVRAAAGDVITSAFCQTSGEDYTGETFVFQGIRIG